MEMDSAELIDDDCIENPYTEMLYSPNFPVNEGVFRDPEVLPRVGDEFQVEIPPLRPVSAYIRLTENPADAETMDGIPHKFTMGLPTSIMQVKEEVQEMKHESLEFLGVSYDSYNKNGSTESGRIIDNSESSGFKVEPESVIEKGECSGVKFESSEIALDHKTRLGESVGLPMQQEMNNKLHTQCGVSLNKPWSDTEEAIFLLGVYIFGKSFDQVKRFIECKNMGDILSFYYGRFYGSNRYHKWKKKCKRRMYGTKIFTGLRQKELLSRLLPRSSEDCHQNMLEVSKTFGEGSMSLEEYVFTLKSMVGMNNLIEAVGLGKKKQDLTRITRESLRSSQGFPVRAEIPIGKACSTLTAEDIVKFLTGDFRLSKARSSDLFWEAVWPRLLARGWHSEQPMDRSYAAGSKHSLVFLMPGFKKFSRRKLVKGNHYFDSVTDVLSKVASEPGILELEIEADKGNLSKEDYGLTDDEKMDQDNLSDPHRHRYLQPRMPKRSADLAKITIIDTSLAHGEKIKVREVRCLQVETLNTSPTRSHSEEIDSDSSEEATNESDPANSSNINQDETNVSKRTKIMLDEELYSDRKDADRIRSNRGFLTNGPSSTVLPEKIPMDQNTDMCNDMQPRKRRKSQSSQRVRLDNSIYLAPVFKRRRRLSACSRTETNHTSNGFLPSPRLKHQDSRDCLDNPNGGYNILSPVDPSQEKLSSTNSCAKSNPIENSRGYMGDGCLGVEYPHEKPQLRMLIDLNIVVPSDAETDEHFTIEVTERQEDKHQDDPNALDTPAGVANSEQHLNMNSRRQGTRNRPLTTKALEALANGYLSIKQRRKRGEAFPQENTVSRPPRRARGRVEVAKNCDDTGFEESKLEEENNEVCASTGAMFGEFQVQSDEGKEVQVCASSLEG